MSVKKQFEIARKLVATNSFDGWIENDGPNCDEDGACQLLKQTDVIDILNQLEKGIKQLIPKSPVVLKTGKEEKK